MTEVFGTRFSYGCLFDDGKLKGIMPCHFIDRPEEGIGCHSPPRHYETSYGGPLADTDDSSGSCLALAKAACAFGKMTVFTAPQGNDWPVPFLWKSSTLQTLYVDLSKSLDEIWNKSLDGKKRNMIRKAEKHNVEVVSGGEEYIDAYYDLVKQMVHRSGMGLKPREYYKGILKAFGPSGKAVVLLATTGGEAYSGGIFLFFNTTAYYWHSASASNRAALGQGELIQWRGIQLAKERGCLWYDLVGFEPERLPHIARFKLGFSRDTRPFKCISYTPLYSRIMNRIKNILGACIL